MVRALRNNKILKVFVSFWLPFAAAAALWVALGHGEEFDLNKTLAAAEKGDAEAEFMLGRAYDSGKGVAADAKKALEYYRRAAEQGNAKAQNNLASLYALGAGGVAQDKVEAKKWLRKAASQGAALPEDNLGIMLAQEGDKEAVEWLAKAAEQGLLSAQLHLGDLYYNGGPAVTQDYSQAAKWLQKAADQGNARAQNVLGVMYQNGRGVKRDLAEAVKWFQRGAEQQNAKAESNLGQMYCVGSGVKADAAEGYKWLTLSAEQNEVTAIKFLVDFKSGMTLDQIAAGQKLVEEYKEHQHSDAPKPSKS